MDVGRVYRIRHADSPLAEWSADHRTRPLQDWTLDQLFTDLGSSVGVWRTDAQSELVRRGSSALADLQRRLNSGRLTTAEQTWTLWTIGLMTQDDPAVDQEFVARAVDDQQPLNIRLQSLRILTHRCLPSDSSARLPAEIRRLLEDEEPRIRHEAVLAVHQARQAQFIGDLLDRADRETDRLVFYSVWTALRSLADVEQRRLWLADERGGVRLAALLGLLEDSDLEADDVLPFRRDPSERVAGLADLWLQKTGGANPIVELSPPPGEYAEPVLVTLKTDLPDVRITYTLDGSTPVKTSAHYSKPIPIGESRTLKVHVEQQATQIGPIVSGEYHIRHVEPWRHREFVTDIQADSGRPYRMIWTGLSVGSNHYTDREYAVTSVPPELAGLPFMQTSNNDDRSAGTDWLRFTSDSDVTLYLGIDVRCDEPPEWMKVGDPDGFTQTALRLLTTDPEFQIYRREFPAGTITLGGNTNRPDDSSRGNYIVILDRPLLTAPPAETSVTEKDVLAAMATADPERGRELFLHPRGAGCVKCHVMEGRGNRFAPDLSDIGSRARRPQILIDSILHPSAVITEGFAQQQVVTTDGRTWAGAILEETGRLLKLVNSDGDVVVIRTSDVEERVSTKVSAMPSGFGKLLTAQQLADIVAWLGTQRSAGDRRGFSFHDKSDRIEIRFQDRVFAEYLKQHPEMTRPGLINVKTISGIQVTRNFPPRTPEDITVGHDGIDHALMHPGIWISFGDIDGNDYWRLNAPVEFDGLTSPMAGTRRGGEFTVRNRYRSEDRTRTVCTEESRYRFRRVDGGVLLRIDSRFGSDDRDFYFGDQEESGLAIRVASPIRVEGGNGTIVNDLGDQNGKQIWGKTAQWFDYFGTIDGRQVGMMVASSPANSRSSWLHARDYGVVVTNPFPRQPQERREPYVKTWVRKGEPLHLTWAVFIHDQPEDQPLNQDTAWELIEQEFQDER